MKIIVGLWHPAHVHTFKNIITKLQNKGHEIKVVAIDKDITLQLLDSYNIPYELVGKSSKNEILNILKILDNFEITFNLWKTSKKFEPDLFLGRASPSMAHLSELLDIPYIAFVDSDINSLTMRLTYSSMNVLFTPNQFEDKTSSEYHFKLPTYKELAYLHPEEFSPDDSILDELNLDPDKKITLMRFVSWEAWHDFEKKGFDKNQKTKLVKRLEKYSNVIISSEDELPAEIEKYKLSISPEKIHDLIFHTDLFIGDSQTMATEAALLGIPTIRHNVFVGKDDMSNFIELSKKYGLIYNLSSSKKVITKALELIKNPETKENWKIKRKSLLKDKLDLSAFLIWFIENYPKSVDQLEKNKDIIWEVGQ